jgi:hypothetical protein
MNMVTSHAKAQFSMRQLLVCEQTVSMGGILKHFAMKPQSKATQIPRMN